MENNNSGQVYLDELIFTQSWEDPKSDATVFGNLHGKKLAAITSGGCNVLNFLKLDPAEIFAVDINPVQSWVLELKITAMKNFEFEDFVAFLGLKDCNDRISKFEKLQSSLSEGAKNFWRGKIETIKEGFLGKGKFEQYTRRSAKMMRMLQGREKVEILFRPKNPEEQKLFFDTQWNTWRLRTAFRFLFSKRKLAKRGLQDEYFQFDDGALSFAENFYNRHRNVIREIPIQGNYFVALYLLGKYKSAEEVPEYLLKENYDEIKSRLDRIKIITEDFKTWAFSQEASSIDAFSLSNICELMNQTDTERTWNSVLHSGKNEAKICFRNLMVPRTVPDELKNKIVRDAEKSKHLIMNDRSFVYSKVDAFQIIK